MITLKCDNCEKPFQIEDDAVGEKVACPYCGDVNRVPQTAAVVAAGRASGSAASSAVSGAPKGPVGGAEPERKITVVRQAMFRAHPFWYSLLVLLFVGGLAVAVLSKSWTGMPSPNVTFYAGLAMAAVGGAWWLFWWAAPHRWVKLTITNKRTIRQEGIVVRKTSEVLHNHIRNVKIEQSFLERLLGVGQISIDSAGGDKDEMIEIHMDHIPRPYKVKEILDQHRRM